MGFLRLLSNRRGAIRALLALLVVVPTIWAAIGGGLYLIVTGNLSEGVALFGVATAAATAVLGCYFGNRSAAGVPAEQAVAVEETAVLPPTEVGP